MRTSLTKLCYWGSPLVTRLLYSSKTRPLVSTWLGSYPYATVCSVNHTLLGRFSKVDFSTAKRVPKPNDTCTSSESFRRGVFNARPFRHPHYSNYTWDNQVASPPWTTRACSVAVLLCNPDLVRNDFLCIVSRWDCRWNCCCGDVLYRTVSRWAYRWNKSVLVLRPNGFVLVTFRSEHSLVTTVFWQKPTESNRWLYCHGNIDHSGKVRYGLDTGTRHFGKFGTSSIPVTETSVSSVRSQYRYPTLR